MFITMIAGPLIGDGHTVAFIKTCTSPVPAANWGRRQRDKNARDTQISFATVPTTQHHFTVSSPSSRFVRKANPKDWTKFGWRSWTWKRFAIVSAKRQLTKKVIWLRLRRNYLSHSLLSAGMFSLDFDMILFLTLPNCLVNDVFMAITLV